MNDNQAGDRWAGLTAAAYGRFALEWPMYRLTSADLVRLAGLPAAAIVVDLCCGTGATTREILRVLGPAGRVVGVDRSAAMLAQARAALAGAPADAARVRLVELPAERLGELAEPGGGPTRPGWLAGGADAVICNSAMWQTELPATFAGAWSVLTPGGRLVFNIGHPFLSDHLTGDAADHRAERTDAERSTQLMARTVALAIEEYGWRPPAGPRRPLPSVAGITADLRAAGFEPRAVRHHTYPMTMAEVHEWLSIPIFTEYGLPGLPYEQRKRILDHAYTQVDPDADGRDSRWAVFVAAKVPAGGGSG